MCAKAIINLSGVTKVVYLEEYRNREGIELLEKAGIKCLNFSTPAA
jgi:deoxycytidylate deaminase